MDYERIIENLDTLIDLDEDVNDARDDAFRIIKAMQKVSEALQYSNNLESMLNRITTIVTELEEGT